MSVPPVGGDLPPSTNAFGVPPEIATVSQDDRTMAMLAHLSGIFTFWVGPLIIYLMKKDQSKFVAYHAMQALILNCAMFVVAFVLVIPVLGLLIFGVANVIRIIFGILACIAANKGDWYEIPVAGKYARQQVGV